jgi:hypothetical protein
MGKSTIGWIDPRARGGAARRELWELVARYEGISFEDFEGQRRELSKALVARHASGVIGGVAAARIFTVGSGRPRGAPGPIEKIRFTSLATWVCLDRSRRGAGRTEGAQSCRRASSLSARCAF